MRVRLRARRSTELRKTDPRRRAPPRRRRSVLGRSIRSNTFGSSTATQGHSLFREPSGPRLLAPPRARAPAPSAAADTDIRSPARPNPESGRQTRGGWFVLIHQAQEHEQRNPPFDADGKAAATTTASHRPSQDVSGRRRSVSAAGSRRQKKGNGGQERVDKEGKLPEKKFATADVNGFVIVLMSSHRQHHCTDDTFAGILTCGSSPGIRPTPRTRMVMSPGWSLSICNCALAEARAHSVNGAALPSSR